jgi:hypothetical protein
MSIPLVQNNEKDSINTSIIAIKRNIERINMLLGLVDSGSPDLSGLATKQELEDAITQVETDLAPVDEVTLDNMQSVTSNAVYDKLQWKTLGDNEAIPEDCTEINITCFYKLDNTEIVYTNQFSTENITGRQNLLIGGYYAGGTDYGLANVNAINRVISKRNFIFGGINYTAQSTLRVRYR